MPRTHKLELEIYDLGWAFQGLLCVVHNQWLTAEPGEQYENSHCSAGHRKFTLKQQNAASRIAEMHPDITVKENAHSLKTSLQEAKEDFQSTWQGSDHQNTMERREPLFSSQETCSLAKFRDEESPLRRPAWINLRKSYAELREQLSQEHRLCLDVGSLVMQVKELNRMALELL